jgi:hypothetical protein
MDAGKPPRMSAVAVASESADRYERWLLRVLKNGRQASYELRVTVDERGAAKLMFRPPWEHVS